MSSKHDHHHHHHSSHDDRKSDSKSKKEYITAKASRMAVDAPHAQGRHEFWAHDNIDNTDDPFEFDFGDDITRPLRSV